MMEPSPPLPPALQHLEQRPHEERAWGRLFRPSSEAPSPEPQELAPALESALGALQDWAGLRMAQPFDVILEPRQVVPLAWPLLPRPALVLPPGSGPTAASRADLIHELAHLLLFAPRSLLLSEGWAVACGYTLATDTRFPFSVRTPEELHPRVLGAPGGAWSLKDYLQGGPACADLSVREAPSERNQLAYGRAGSFVLWLIATGGVERFVRVMQELARQPSRTEEEALRQAYGHPLEALEQQWRQAHTPVSAPPPVAASEAEDPLRSALAGAWTMYTDQAIQGNSTGTFTEAEGVLSVTGRMGTRGAFQFVSAYRYLRQNRSRVDVSGLRGLRFEARGDGKSYQLWLATPEAKEPGKEFMYLFSTQGEWVRHEVPFTQLQRFATDGLAWTGKELGALGVRAFGYRAQSVTFAIRNLEFYA